MANKISEAGSGTMTPPKSVPTRESATWLMVAPAAKAIWPTKLRVVPANAPAPCTVARIVTKLLPCKGWEKEREERSPKNTVAPESDVAASVAWFKLADDAANTPGLMAASAIGPGVVRVKLGSLQAATFDTALPESAKSDGGSSPGTQARTTFKLPGVSPVIKSTIWPDEVRFKEVCDNAHGTPNMVKTKRATTAEKYLRQLTRNLQGGIPPNQWRVR